ncbi:MAG TPA: TonB-dependent receptor, partial [Terriglobales bacterium]|nr:TonB-dependent receptor [Terriglobales bacterium]
MRLTLTFFLFASSAALTLSAQESAQISGFVYDRSEAAVPGVALSITRSGTGIAFRTSSDRSGHFVFAALPPGPYSLDLKKEGFQTAVANDIELHVNDRQELIFHLEIGPLSQTVFVSGSTPVVNTADGSVSTVVDRGFVDNLPMNGRTFQSLIRLTPGVVFTPTGGGNAGQFVVNGMRSDDNYFTVDGVSASFGLGGLNATTLYQGGGGQLPALSVLGSTNSLVSMDAMEEFRIQTSSFAPEFGRLPGGQVSIVTRSGTNRFHGSLSEYFRHDALNANEWFANRAGLPRAKERSNLFSGVLGGPIVKDRTFFFASYEGQRVDQPVTLSGTVPSSAIRATAPAAIQPFLAAFPLPTGAALADGSAPFTATASNPASLD